MFILQSLIKYICTLLLRELFLIHKIMFYEFLSKLEQFLIPYFMLEKYRMDIKYFQCQRIKRQGLTLI